ncbi:MAG: NAD-dependent epimerase/dehydratase family protein [Candidatus Schekmanbacteria bacterium]|nr:NAD-dependent epimerase/dehydratase family protein [Candidatus Schekmanbacteria bacterium]
MKPLRALVTGATGFIGGHLVERLVQVENAPVRAFVRGYQRAAGLSRFGVDMVQGSLTDPASVNAAVRGCDVVFHLAHDFADPLANVTAARLLADACLHHGAQRLVYASSISVYHPLPDGRLDESANTEPCGWAYPDNKLAIERYLLQRAATDGLPVVVLQPTIVYGPRGGAWTVGPLRQVVRGRIVLPDAGAGLCNPVHVDDVVDAFCLAAVQDAAAGKRFLISGAAAVTWREYYAFFERLTGRNTVVCMPYGRLRRLVRLQAGIIRLIRRPAKAAVRSAARTGLLARPRWMQSVLGEQAWRALKKRIRGIPIIPDEERLDLFRAKPTVCTDHARSVLGFAPRIALDAGMEQCAAWLRWAGLA